MDTAQSLFVDTERIVATLAAACFDNKPNAVAEAEGDSSARDVAAEGGKDGTGEGSESTEVDGMASHGACVQDIWAHWADHCDHCSS